LRSISYDKGFHSPDNQRDLKVLLEKVVMPKKKASSQKSTKLMNLSLNSGDCDGNIRQSNQQSMRLRFTAWIYGLNHGIKGFNRYVALAVLARNIHRYGALLFKKDAKRHRGPYKKAA
jgi:IS5 family transposase